MKCSFCNKAIDKECYVIKIGRYNIHGMFDGIQTTNICRNCYELIINTINSISDEEDK